MSKLYVKYSQLKKNAPDTVYLFKVGIFYNETLVIYQKYLDLIYYTNDLCRIYPKSEKPALAAETKQSLYDGLKHLQLYNSIKSAS